MRRQVTRISNSRTSFTYVEVERAYFLSSFRCHFMGTAPHIVGPLCLDTSWFTLITHNSLVHKPSRRSSELDSTNLHTHTTWDYETCDACGLPTTFWPLSGGPSVVGIFVTTCSSINPKTSEKGKEAQSAVHKTFRKPSVVCVCKLS